ncbi:RAM signaling pathway protein-domain-containing protein [Geopyxis carbonaria]|nr:RAM signaling pathway protein-domain-containing protein [Geopyxis carbonaria]
MQSQQLSAPVPRQNGPPVPIDNATCLSLVVNALNQARDKAREIETRSRNGASLGEIPGSSLRPGVTIDLSHAKIANIPLEVIELIKDEIERLALAHNQLSSFPNEFASLPRLRYLNLRSNFLKEFPTALTRLPSLEILDVSRNRLRALPPDLGNLMSLKVLSMSKNKINILPTYIGDMKELKILKLDHNPIVFPPKEIYEKEESDRDAWLDGVKRFLRQHAERSKESQDNESGLSGGSSDEGDGDLSSFNHSFSRTPSFESEATEEPQTVRPLRLNSLQVDATSKINGPLKGPSTGFGRKHKNFSSSSINSMNNNTSPVLNTSSFSPNRPEPPQSAVSLSLQAERNRSNSESTVGSIREKRKGMLPPSRPTPPAPRPKPTIVESRLGDDKPPKHTRGLSHDSLVGGATNNNAPSKSPTDPEKRPGQYFRRLSSLPEHKRSSLSTARVGEAARGILYAMSTLQKPIEQYVQSTADPGGPHEKVERALYNGNIHVGSLVSALEAYEEKDDEPSVQKVIDACHACVAAFRQVLGMLQSSMKELGTSSSGPDIRYCRTLLLMLYGSYIEIQTSYEVLQPLLLAQTISDGSTNLRSGSLTSRQQPIMNVAMFPSTTGSNTDSGTSQSAHMPPATPRSGESFHIPQTPATLPSSTSQQSDSGFDQEDALYQKFQAATTAAITTLPQIDLEIKSAATQNLQPHITLKLREVSTLCISGTDAARRLSTTRWQAIQEGDVNERRKFWDETNKFTQVMI